MQQITCNRCNKPFLRVLSQINEYKTHYCSHSCYWKSLKGTTNNNKKSRSLGIKPTERQKQLIIGTTLGDGFLCLAKGMKNANLAIAQVDKSYVLWKKELLDKLAPGKLSISIPKNHRYQPMYRFTTATHPFLTKLHKLFYSSGRKTIPISILKYLSPLALAVWFMDDGSKQPYPSKRGFNIRFATDSFTEKEVQILQKFLNKKYHIQSYINFDRRTDVPILTIRPYSEALKFIKLVKPYIVPSMRYKLSCQSAK